jgi:hypothetical protein
MIRMSGVDEAGGLLAEHLLLKMTMEKGVGDVHLVNRPAARHDELEHGANGPGLDNLGKGLSEINAGSLKKAANDPSRLMPIKSSVRMELVLED